MRRREMWKRMGAAALSAAMVLSNSSFAALAQEPETAMEASVEEMTEEMAETALTDETDASETSEAAAAEETEEDTAGENGGAADTLGEDDGLLEEEEFVLGDAEEIAEEAGMMTLMEGETAEEGAGEAQEYEVYFTNLRNGDMHYHWIFTDEEQSGEAAPALFLDDRLSGEAYSVRIEAGLIDMDIAQGDTEEDPFRKHDALTAAVQDEKGNLTLNGRDLATILSENDTDWFVIRAYVKENTEDGAAEVARGAFTLNVREPVYDYWWPGTEPGERDLLPGQRFDIGDVLGYYVENQGEPYGAEDSCEITGVEITEQAFYDGAAPEDNPEAPFGAEAGQDENGCWYIQGTPGNHGYVKFVIHYTSPETGDKAVSEEMKLDFRGDIYRLEADYDDGSEELLLNATKNISLRLMLEGQDEERGDFYDEVTEEYTLEIAEDDQGNPAYDTGLIRAEIAGHTVTVTSNNEGRYGDNDLWVAAKVNEEEVCQIRLHISVREEYYLLLPAGLENVGVGEELDLSSVNFELKLFDADNGKGVERLQDDDCRVRLDGFSDSVFTFKEGTEDDLLPTLVRNGGNATGGGRLTVVGECKQLDEEGNPVTDEAGNEIWDEVTSREYWFDGLGYDTGFADLRDDGDRTWIYSDEEMTLAIDTSVFGVENGEAGDSADMPSEESGEASGTDNAAIAYEWTLGNWDENGELTEQLAKGTDYTDNKDGSITLHGKELAKKYTGDNTRFGIRCAVRLHDVIVWEGGVDVEVREPRYEYYWPGNNPGDRDLLVDNDDFWISNTMEGYMEDKDHPYGVDLRGENSVQVTDVQIVSQWTYGENGDVQVGEEEEPVVTLEEREDGWNIYGNRVGFVRVQMTYIDPVTMESATYGGAESDDFIINVSDNTWWLELEFPENSDQILPGGTKTIKTGLRNRWKDENGNYQEKYYDDGYMLKLAKYSSDENNGVHVSMEGTNIKVTADEESGGADFYIDAVWTDENEDEQSVTAKLYINVQECYFVLLPAKLDMDNIGLGESIDFSAMKGISLMRYDREHPAGEEESKENYRLRVNDYQRNVFTQDGENPLRLTRNGEHSTGGGYIRLAAVLQSYDENGDPMKDENGDLVWEDEAASQNYDFDGIGFEVRFDELRNEADNNTWIYTNEKMQLSVSIKDASAVLPEGCTYVWSIGQWGDNGLEVNEEATNDCIISSQTDGTTEDGSTPDGESAAGQGPSIILDGAKLAEYYEPNTENSSFGIECRILYNGEEIGGAGAGVNVREPRYEYKWPDSEWNSWNQVIGQEMFISNTLNVYAEDGEHPDGADVTTTIRNITISKQYRYTETGKEVVTDGVAELTKSDGGWTLKGLDNGEIELTIKYQSLETGKEEIYEATENTGCRFYFGPEVYDLRWADSEDDIYVRSGQTLTIGSELWKKYLDENDNYYKEDKDTEDYVLHVRNWNEGDGESYYPNGGLLESVNSDEAETSIVLNVKQEAAGWYEEICVQAIPRVYPEGQSGWDYGNRWIRVHLCDHSALAKVEAKDATCTEKGNIEHWYCETCDGYFSDENAGQETAAEDVVIQEKGHQLTKTEEKEATCLAPGNRAYWTCDVCKKLFEDEAGTKETLLGNVTTTKGHSLTETAAKEATCTEAGNKAYWTCTNGCGKSFWDAQAKTEIGEDETVIIAATGHSLEKVEAKAATCTEDGNTEHWKCSNCGELFADEKGETTAEAVKTAAEGHDLTKIDAVAATCTTDGSNAYWTCSKCGKVFSDAEGTTETTVEAEKIAANGHTEEILPAVAATCKATGLTEGKKCSVCGDTLEGLQPIGKLPATIETNAVKDKIVLKAKQSTKGFKVSGLAEGDEIVSMTVANKKVVKISAINLTAGTCKLTAQKLTGKKGKTTLTVKLASGLEKKISVSVQSAAVKTSAITGVTKTLTLKKGEKLALKPTVVPFTSKDKVKYKTSNKKVVTVSSKGALKGVKPGKAKITLTAGKKKFTVNVTVTQ